MCRPAYVSTCQPTCFSLFPSFIYLDLWGVSRKGHYTKDVQLTRWEGILKELDGQEIASTTMSLSKQIAGLVYLRTITFRVSHKKPTHPKPIVLVAKKQGLMIILCLSTKNGRGEWWGGHISDLLAKNTPQSHDSNGQFQVL